ncbi:MAG: Rieske (2Fe-2S) protein [Gemmatimonadetes bacterium]|nr:Rieske (2Fe-2S) protein [Gemmatimonadota bacterium]MYG84909.1 Rieske (2Fe-2S) protein [Gemmatimonadota bacterium]MYJ89098.1 Rieske (2Fe-2S) protein [Gemmatimonadota bacterium]
MSAGNGWIRVGSLADVPPGESRAVKISEGRSVALFNVDGRIHATDNQCPHMGFPLTRGVVKDGVLTCDWHGRSFDLEGGGCFNYECDDLETFPVDIRGDELWVQAGDATYRRRDQHLQLLWEGLLSGDSWTISKATALLLSGGVSEHDIVQLVLRHLGRHVASEQGAGGGGDIVSLLVSGLEVGRRYDGEDRLMALSLAGRAASGRASERLEVITLPPPVSWDQIDGWVRMFSRNMQDFRIERCLHTARENGQEEHIFKLLFECAVAPYFLGFARNVANLGDLARVVDTFGWGEASELVCNLGAKMVGRGRDEPERFHRDAVRLLEGLAPELESRDYGANTRTDYDENAFVDALLSVDVERAFEAVAKTLREGVAIERLITTFVLLAADRMARTPVNVDAGWGSLSTEYNLAASLRHVLVYGGPAAAAKGLFHAAWQIFDNRWINIPSRALDEPLPDHASDAPDGVSASERIVHAIKSLDIHGVGDQVVGYLNSGFDGSELLREIGRAILWDDTNMELLPTLRVTFNEWEGTSGAGAGGADAGGADAARGSGHPSRYQLLVGLARYATDVRLNKNSMASINTAMRFSEGRTTVEVFDD